MYVEIPVFRAVCFGKPVGPWRLRMTVAREDAIAERLGTYDECGTYFDIVPGGIQCKRVCPRLLGLSDQQIDDLITSERRAKLYVRQLRMSRRPGRSRDAADLSSRALIARDRI